MQIKNTIYGLGVILAVVLLGGVGSTQTVAAAGCTFTRDLQMGTVGDDVKCLQQYLNKNGFPIATTGVGSAGKETGEYKVLTEAAVVAWQKKNTLVPASGFFGGKSRVKFTELQSGATVAKPAATTTKSSSVASTLQAQVDAINKVLTDQSGTQPLVSQTIVTIPAVSSAAVPADVKSVHAVMKKALDAIKTAEGTIADNSDAPDIKKANKNLVRAYKDFFTAMRTYLSGDYETTKVALLTVVSSAKAATEIAGTLSEEKQAEKAISEADTTISDVSDAIDTAEEDGEAVSKSIKLLKSAKNSLAGAETAFDNEDYTVAIDAAQEAKSAAKKAELAIGEKVSAAVSVASVRKSLASARTTVKTEIKSGTDVGDAKSLLNDAEAALDAAGDAETAGSDAKVLTFVAKAQKLIKSALNEF